MNLELESDLNWLSRGRRAVRLPILQQERLQELFCTSIPSGTLPTRSAAAP